MRADEAHDPRRDAGAVPTVKCGINRLERNRATATRRDAFAVGHSPFAIRDEAAA